MVKIKELKTLLLVIIQFQVILSSDEVSQNSILERLDSIEAVQELHNLKIEQVETLFTGLKGKVDRLEIKDKDILGDLGKLDRKIADISVSVSSLSSMNKLSEQRPQSNKLLNKMKTTNIPPTSKLAPTFKSDPDFKVVRKLPLYHAEGKSYPLMNKHGRCLAVETSGKIHPSENGAKIVQSTCDPTEKGQLWKYDKQKYLLCNDWNKCLSLPLGSKFGKGSFDVFHWDLNDIKNVKAWWISLSHSGDIYNVDLGTCLSFEGNSDNHGERAITKNCNNKTGEKGQMWSFVQY